MIIIGITILSSVASVVAMGTTLKNDVDNIKLEIQEAGPRHTEVIDSIDERLRTCENTNTAVLVKLENIEKGIDTINLKIDKHYEGSP